MKTNRKQFTFNRFYFCVLASTLFFSIFIELTHSLNSSTSEAVTFVSFQHFSLGQGSQTKIDQRKGLCGPKFDGKRLCELQITRKALKTSLIYNFVSF